MEDRDLVPVLCAVWSVELDPCGFVLTLLQNWTVCDTEICMPCVSTHPLVRRCMQMPQHYSLYQLLRIYYIFPHHHCCCHHYPLCACKNKRDSTHQWGCVENHNTVLPVEHPHLQQFSLTSLVLLYRDHS